MPLHDGARCVVARRFLLPFLCVALFVIQMGLSLSNLPSVTLMQDILCKKSRGITSSDALLPEEDCHSDDVQRELNLISIGSLISVTVGGALVALPFGMLSDRIGRLSVLGLSIAGLFLSEAYAIIILWQSHTVPLKAIWGLGVPILMGGGRSVAESMVFTIISDIIPPSSRTLWFQFIVAAVISAQIISPLVAGYLMRFSPWIPLCTSLGLIIAGGLILIIFTPETLHLRNAQDLESIHSNHSQQQQKSTKTPLQTLKTLFTRPLILLLPSSILTIPLATAQSDLILRLMPLQFQWSLKNSSLLTSLGGLVTLVTLILILPLFSHFLSRIEHPQRDRILARASATLFIAASLTFMMITNSSFIIAGVVLAGLSAGLPTLCRSLLVSQLPNGCQMGSVFGILAMGEVIGFLYCQLSLGALFDAGLGTWAGLPFCLGTVVAGVIGGTAWAFSFPPFRNGITTISFN